MKAKRLLIICCSLAAVFWTTIAIAGSSGMFSFPFIGRWQPSEDPLLLDDYGLQDIQNMRKDGKTFVPVKGSALLEDYSALGTYDYPTSIFHYRKDYPEYVSFLALRSAVNKTGSSGRLYLQEINPPDTFTLSPTYYETDDTSAEYGLFVMGPQGVLVYCNGVSTKIWGHKVPILSAITSKTDISGGGSDLLERTDSVIETDDDESLHFDSISYDYMLIGSPYRLDGIDVKLATANGTTSTITGSYWNSSSSTWAALTITDGTSSGGVALDVDGQITWTGPTDANQQPVFVRDKVLYWYQLHLDAGVAYIDQMTGLTSIQPITNIWDGSEIPITSFRHYAASDPFNTDSVLYAQDNDITTSVELDSYPLNFGLYFGFTQPVQAIFPRLTPGKANSAASAGTETMNYWDGAAWQSTSALGEWVDGIPFSETGVTYWPQIDKGLEVAKDYNGTGRNSQDLHYYYQGYVTNTMDSEVEMYYATGIPSVYGIGNYKIPAVFRNRLFLFNKVNGDPSETIYSASNTSYIFNGDDSGKLYIGEGEAITCAGVVYNPFRTIDGVEQLLVMTINKTYRVTGSGPEDWNVSLLHDGVGCVAPGSVAQVIIPNPDGKGDRGALMWASGNGVVSSDGSTIRSVSHDIRKYWDNSDSDAIDVDEHPDTNGWYDASVESYKLVVSSGSGADDHNLELEYSLRYNEWTKLSRVTGELYERVQAGCTVSDSYGRIHTYGATDRGAVLLLETGDQWRGATDIAKYLHTGDLLLDNRKGVARPFFYNTTVDWVRVMFEDQAAGAGDVAWYHWLDGVQTTYAVDSQYPPSNINLIEGPVWTTNCTLGPGTRHSFKLTSDGNMRLTGMGFVYTVYETITE